TPAFGTLCRMHRPCNVPGCRSPGPAERQVIESRARAAWHDACKISGVDHALPTRARAFIALTSLVGLLVIGSALVHWESADILKFTGFLAVATFSAGVRINVTGVMIPL